MCDKCYSTLANLVKPHEMSMCPLKRSLYCGVCAIYGHSSAACPDTVTHLFRTPHYMEQLIPPSLMEEYAINTRTPIAALPRPESRLPPLCIMETAEALRAVLISIDVKPKICQAQNSKEEIKVNRARIISEMEGVGREVAFIEPTVVAKAKRVK